MRRLLLVRLDALQLQRFHRPCLAVDILLQAFQPFALLDHDAVQLLHLVFQVGDGGFKLFGAPGMFVSHGRILPVPPPEVEGGRRPAEGRHRKTFSHRCTRINPSA